MINDAGLEIITHFEGFRAEPYLDTLAYPAVWTVGYGSTRGRDGRPVHEYTLPVTEETAKDLLRRDTEHAERFITRLIRVPLNENELSALISFTYNLGVGNLQKSVLRMKLNRSDRIGAADEFPKWRRAGGRILRGLVRRRAAERELFLAPA